MNSTGTTPAKRASAQQPASSSQTPAFSHREGKKKTQSGNILPTSLKLDHQQGPLTLSAQNPGPPAPKATCPDSETRYLVGIPYSSTLLDMCHLVPF